MQVVVVWLVHLIMMVLVMMMMGPGVDQRTVGGTGPHRTWGPGVGHGRGPVRSALGPDSVLGCLGVRQILLLLPLRSTILKPDFHLK